MKSCMITCKQKILEWLNTPSPLGARRPPAVAHRKAKKERVKACLRRLMLCRLDRLYVANPPTNIQSFDDLTSALEFQIICVPCPQLDQMLAATRSTAPKYTDKGHSVVFEQLPFEASAALTRTRRQFVDLLKEWYIAYLVQNAIPTPPPLPTPPVKKPTKWISLPFVSKPYKKNLFTVRQVMQLGRESSRAESICTRCHAARARVWARGGRFSKPVDAPCTHRHVETWGDGVWNCTECDEVISLRKKRKR